MTPSVRSTVPWRVFYSYSHKDSDARAQLATYLAPLKSQGRIEEWHDRRIEPGTAWERAILSELDSADLILLLISEHFLASEYCFGIEMDRALTRLKFGEVRVVPVLLKPCLWKDSRFSELQMLPRDAKPILSWGSQEEAYFAVASELAAIVASPPPKRKDSLPMPPAAPLTAPVDLVREQVHALAGRYERTRQRMRPSEARTARMERTFSQMRALATVTYPLLDELTTSPSPGERLAAVAILQVFASERYLNFLVALVGVEKPFVEYQALLALKFAASALDARAFPQLLTDLARAKQSLDAAGVAAGTDRQRTLHEANDVLHEAMGGDPEPGNGSETGVRRV